MTYLDLQEAFEFVSAARELEHIAVVDKQTGETYFKSEVADTDELPEDVDSSDKYLPVPHKNELGLGSNLVFEFASQHLPDEMDEIEAIFSRKGAYGRFKRFLDDRNMLRDWYAYEESETERRLRSWGASNGIVFTDETE